MSSGSSIRHGSAAQCDFAVSAPESRCSVICVCAAHQYLLDVSPFLRHLRSACSEAHSATNGIGLVKLMGRSAGFIALYASLASRDVNVCLIPEAPWRLSKLCSYLEERLDRSRHAVIVVAEGAESIERAEEKAAAAAAGGGGKRTDESGNPVLDDVGEYIKAGVLTHFKKRGIP